MAGTRAGGLKAAATNKELYDKDYAEYGGFYGFIGKKGGKASVATGRQFGFMGNREAAQAAGRKGGAVTKRNRAAKADG